MTLIVRTSPRTAVGLPWWLALPATVVAGGATIAWLIVKLAATLILALVALAIMVAQRRR